MEANSDLVGPMLLISGVLGGLGHHVQQPARHLADLRTALDALFSALDPVRGDLTQLDERLAARDEHAAVAGSRASN